MNNKNVKQLCEKKTDTTSTIKKTGLKNIPLKSTQKCETPAGISVKKKNLFNLAYTATASSMNNSPYLKISKLIQPLERQHQTIS